jgi:hypothetical protein
MKDCDHLQITLHREGWNSKRNGTGGDALGWTGEDARPSTSDFSF